MSIDRFLRGALAAPGVADLGFRAVSDLAAPQPAALTVDAAAGYCALTASQLDKLRLTGGGPVYVKMGRRIAYLRTDLDAWLAERRRASTSASAPPAARSA